MSFIGTIRSAGLSPEDEVKFGNWAFGPNWELKPTYVMDDLWNARHSDLLLVKGTDSVDKTTLKMIALWKEAQETLP